MNEARFWMFFTVLFDLHNHSKQGNLRSIVNPRSNLRWRNINDIPDYETELLKSRAESPDSVEILDEEDSETVVENELMNHAHKQDTSGTVENKDDAVLVEEMSNLMLEKHICDVCGAKYKVPWTLKSHMVKKHNTKIACKHCDETFSDKISHDIHLSKHIFSCTKC